MDPFQPARVFDPISIREISILTIFGKCGTTVSNLSATANGRTPENVPTAICGATAKVTVCICTMMMVNYWFVIISGLNENRIAKVFLNLRCYAILPRAKSGEN